MNSLCLQMLWLTKLLFLTLRTVEWVFHLYEIFHGSSNYLMNWISTHIWTAEWFFTSMNSFMCLQMLGLTELLFALRAVECFSSLWIISFVFKGSAADSDIAVCCWHVKVSRLPLRLLVKDFWVFLHCNVCHLSGLITFSATKGKFIATNRAAKCLP